MTANLPSYSGFNSSPKPMIAGIFIVLAKIAVCEFEEPYIVAKPNTFSLSSWTVSLGTRSSAATMTGSSVANATFSAPDKMFKIRSETSFTSAARPCIYASSIAENIAAKLSAVVPTAYSAFTCCAVIILIIDSM